MNDYVFVKTKCMDLSLRQTAENGDFPLEEYKHCVVLIEYLVL